MTNTSGMLMHGIRQTEKIMFYTLNRHVFVKNNLIKFTYSGYPDYGGTVLSNMYYRFFDRILVKT